MKQKLGKGIFGSINIDPKVIVSDKRALSKSFIQSEEGSKNTKSTIKTKNRFPTLSDEWACG